MIDVSKHRVWRVRTVSGDVFWTLDLTKEQLTEIAKSTGFVKLAVYRSLSDLGDENLLTTVYVRHIESLLRVLPAFLNEKAGDE